MIVAATTLHSTWKHFQARFAEWQNALVLFGWGIYLTLHPGMFTNPGTIGLWSGLLRIANQETWAMLCLVVGLARLGALYVNGRHRRTPMIRLIGSFFSAFVITQIVVGLVNSGTPSTGLIVYPVLILADIYSAFRASADMTFVARQEIEEDKTERSGGSNFAQRT